MLLDSGLVEYKSVSSLIENMLSAVELNGPAELNDATAEFWHTLLIIRAQENIGSAGDSPRKVLLWLFKRWGSGK